MNKPLQIKSLTHYSMLYLAMMLTQKKNTHNLDVAMFVSLLRIHFVHEDVTQFKLHHDFLNKYDTSASKDRQPPVKKKIILPPIQSP